LKAHLLENFYIMAERLHHYLHQPVPDSPQQTGTRAGPPVIAEAAENYGKGNYTLIVDLGRHEVTYQGLPVDLPPTAFRLLSLLAEKPDRIVSKEELYSRLWGGAGADTGPYEHQLADHKRKILAQIGKAFEAQHGKKPKADQLRNLITAKHRVGYRLNLPSSGVRVLK
jgi:DNA-binding response OmpR family regulator